MKKNASGNISKVGTAKFPRLVAAKAALKEGRKGDAILAALGALERENVPLELVLGVARIARSQGLNRFALEMTRPFADAKLANPEIYLLRARCLMAVGDEASMLAMLALAESNGGKASEIKKVHRAAEMRRAKRDGFVAEKTE